MTIKIEADEKTKKKLARLYRVKNTRDLVIDVNGEPLILAFCGREEDTKTSLMDVTNEIAREYWKRHTRETYVEGTKIKLDEFACFGMYTGHEACQRCKMAKECEKQ